MAFEASRSPRSFRSPSAEDDDPKSAQSGRMVAIPIDAFADAALARVRDESRRDVRCDACDAVIEGEPAGAGVFLTTRGDEVRFDEPVLCEPCATAIGVRANHDGEIEEEEG